MNSGAVHSEKRFSCLFTTAPKMLRYCSEVLWQVGHLLSCEVPLLKRSYVLLFLFCIKHDHTAHGNIFILPLRHYVHSNFVLAFSGPLCSTQKGL